MSEDRIGVIGAGTMGSGIAQVAAQSGADVVLYDISEDLVEAGAERIRGFWTRGVEKGRMTSDQKEAAEGRLTTTTSLEDFSACGLIIEAAPERMDLKQQLFKDLDRICPPGAILATNTSSLSVTVIAASTGRPAQVAGMHFFNPAPLMPLVEIVKGARTDAATLAALTDRARQWEKDPVVTADVPGFIVNRVARPFYGEALKIVGERLAPPADVDAVMEAAGFRMGPFTLMDLIGIDVNLAVTKSVWEATFGEPRYRPHLLQERMVAQGRLGWKSGTGFYTYDSEGSSDRPAPTGVGQEEIAALASGGPEHAAEWLRVSVEHPALPDRILPRILGMLLNEAAFALGEGVATKRDIDTAMRKGTNWPEGPLAWAETVGLKNLAALLDGLHAAFGEERYRTAPLLRRLVRAGAMQFPDAI